MRRLSVRTRQGYTSNSRLQHVIHLLAFQFSAPNRRQSFAASTGSGQDPRSVSFCSLRRVDLIHILVGDILLVFSDARVELTIPEFRPA